MTSDKSRLRILGRVTPVVIALGVALPVQAEESVTEKVDHGEINWTKKTVWATGSGAPNPKLGHKAKIRLAAERAAQIDAYRNILETMKGVRITATQLGSDPLKSAQVRTQVQGMIRGCKRKETRYYEDGGVDVELVCNLDGGLAAAIAPVKKRTKVHAKGEKKYSGLVIDAVGAGAQPALSPRILDESGAEVYSAKMVSPTLLRKHGAAAFTRSVDAAKADPRVGKTPLVLKATTTGEFPTDIKISNADAAKLAGLNLTFLAEARVIIAM